ncbi:MAG: SDR family oxidoreductase [Chloroflexi bacterium]|nr:MAG: SDR family oxidoreductase [Chloroflexota bacterium]
MNFVVLGATGRTGRLVVEQAIAAGHTVTALVRSPEKLTTGNSNLRVISGEATDASAVSRALKGADAVISTLGGKGSLIADSTQAIVTAARAAGVSRVVVLSSWVVERSQMDVMTRFLTGITMGPVIRDKSAGEHVLRQSDLEWTIVYPSLLTDGPATGSVAVLPEGAKRRMSERISRADVAAWMVQAAAGDQYNGRSIGITGDHRA